jgi:anaerobic glycerol-3-phosphate dehydrogenase
VVDGWTVTTDSDGETVYVRSFRVDGGQAVIQMSEGKVDLVTATPSPGYTVQTVQNEPANLAVQFTEQNHYFIIHALWHNNAPFAEVSEVGS